MKEVENYYIVSVICKDRLERIQDRLLWLCDDTGYPSHTSFKGGAKKFKNKPTKKEIDSYSGYPWYDLHVFGTEKVYQVNKTVIITEEEVV
jgi:CRISPR/Cas system type I-B associated protein Csh2 (Cas7 group RAMP superfamily)